MFIVIIIVVIIIVVVFIGKSGGSSGNNESAEQQRQQETAWAQELKLKVPAAFNTCQTNSGYDCTLISGQYVAGEEMENLLAELTAAAELQGRIAYLADEMAGEEGAL